MTEKARKPGAGERLRQMGYLLKHSLGVIGRDRDILGPTVRATIYMLVLVSSFFGMILLYTLGYGGYGTLLLLACGVLFFYKYFYYTRQSMAQSWLVAETVRGRDAVPGTGYERVSGIRSQARLLGWIDMAMAYVSSRGKDADGENGGILLRLVVAALGEAWDLVRNFLIPAVVVDEVNLRDGAGRMQNLKDEVPETLVGVFGIDMAAGAVLFMMAPVYLVLILIALGIGLLVGDAVPAFYAGEVHAWLGNSAPGWLPEPLHFSWLPLLIAIWIGKLFSGLLKRLVESMKVLYFTVFYLRIAHPEDITPDMREELDHYLRMERETGPDAEPAGAME